MPTRPEAVQRAIRAGVRCIEHGQLVDDATEQMIAETGTLWSVPPFLSNIDILKQASSVAGSNVAECGTRNAYPAPLGVITPGAWADILLFDGDPTADLMLFATPERHLAAIMKNGVVLREPT